MSKEIISETFYSYPEYKNKFWLILSIKSESSCCDTLLSTTQYEYHKYEHEQEYERDDKYENYCWKIINRLSKRKVKVLSFFHCNAFKMKIRQSQNMRQLIQLLCL